MRSLWKSFRYTVRSLRKAPGLVLTVVLTLGLCIGANTTIFSLLTSFFQRLPVPEPERMVGVYTSGPVHGPWGRTSWPDYEDYRDRNQVLSGLLARLSFGATMNVDGSSEWVWGSIVSGNYFDVLGLEARPGRTFTPDEQEAGGPRTAVISHAFWRNRFGGQESVVGKRISLNGHDFTIVGVAPQSFLGVNALVHPKIWVPMHTLEALNPAAFPQLEVRRARFLSLVGHLSPGVSLEQARAHLETLAASLEQEYPEEGNERRVTVEIATIMPPSARDWYLPSARLLMAAVGVLLLIGCVNIGSLMMARALAKRPELGTRLALGSGRVRIAREVLMETLVLAVAGGLVGLALSYWATDVIAGYFAPAIPGDLGDAPVMSPNGLVFAFVAAIVVLATFVSGLIPALRIARSDLVTALKREETPSRSRWHSRWRLGWGSALVVLQVALSVMLLVGAGLIVRSLDYALDTDPGYELDHVLLASINLRPAGLDEGPGRRLYDELLRRVRGLPGVESATLVGVAPLNGYSEQEVIALPSRPDEPIEADSNVVGPDYWSTLGVPVLAGRELTVHDDPGSATVVVVNETLAKEHWPGEDPLGREILFPYWGDEPVRATVVGLVRDSRYLSLVEEPRAQLYIPFDQQYRQAMMLMARTSSHPGPLMPSVRQILHDLDGNAALIYTVTLRQFLENSIWEPRMRAEVLQAFAFLALLLAAVGLFSLLRYTVSRHRREIGIRMALGADRRQVQLSVVRRSALLVGLGVAFGLPLALLAGRTLSSFLIGIGSLDPLTFAVSVAVILVIALVASWLPARQASRVNPAETMKAM